MARTSCSAEGCKARKPNHKMYEVKRSRADPTVIGHACSRACVAKVAAADMGPVIQASPAGPLFGIHAASYASGPVIAESPPLTVERVRDAAERHVARLALAQESH